MIDMKETLHVLLINPVFVVLLLRQRVEATGVSNPASVMRNQSRGSSFQGGLGQRALGPKQTNSVDYSGSLRTELSAQTASLTQETLWGEV